MICGPCRMAGAYNAVNAVKDRAVELHAQCKGGTWCCCQHKLGDYRNRRTDG